MMGRFALCQNNRDYPASSEVRKLYRVIEYAEAASEDYIRFVDESGEDFAFATNRFHMVDLPVNIERELLKGGLESPA